MVVDDSFRLVVGADSVLGTALARQLTLEGIRFVGTSRRKAQADLRLLDLGAPECTWDLPHRVDVAYILAGVTNMAACEADPTGTAQINVDATLALSRALHRRGAHVIVVSTNLVLSGERPHGAISDLLAPQNVYAQQKAAVECALCSSSFGGTSSVLRITKIAESLRGLLGGWAAELRDGRSVSPFDDLICAPMPLKAAIAALCRLGDLRSLGIHHYGADQDISYTMIAKRLARFLGCSPSLVHGTTSCAAGIKLPALPKFTTLDDADTRARLSLPQLHTAKALDAVFRDVAGGSTQDG